jgi:hypothetical protein
MLAMCKSTNACWPGVPSLLPDMFRSTALPLSLWKLLCTSSSGQCSKSPHVMGSRMVHGLETHTNTVVVALTTPSLRVSSRAKTTPSSPESNWKKWPGWLTNIAVHGGETTTGSCVRTRLHNTSPESVPTPGDKFPTLLRSDTGMSSSVVFTAPLVTGASEPTPCCVDTLLRPVTSLWSPTGVDYTANHATTRPKTGTFFIVINQPLATKPKSGLLIYLNSNNLGKFELTNIP